MVDWLNDNSGAVQAISVVVLAVVTAVYAGATLRIAGATRRQADAARSAADASRDMTREIREQRLAQDRPYVLVDLMNPDRLDWPGALTRVSAGPNNPKASQENSSWLSAYPRSVHCRIYNAGRGPAKEIEVTMLHPEEMYKIEQRGFLLPGETWDVEIEQRGTWTIVVRKTQPDDLAEWLKLQGHDAVEICAYNAGIVVDYRDIHEQLWAHYVALGLGEKRTVLDGEIEIRRTLVALEQRTLPSKRYTAQP